MEAWRRGFTTKSDFARESADFVAMAASAGLITTQIAGPQLYGREWQITSKGLHSLEQEYRIDIRDETEEGQRPQRKAGDT